jgi:hypothetical protein
LTTPMPPRASSTRTTSVKVPPMSTPILQLMEAHYTDNKHVNAIAPSWFESNIGELIHREPGNACALSSFASSTVRRRAPRLWAPSP